MKRLLFLLLFCVPCYSKVYDCFPFFNEIELLTVHLEEMWDKVDYFVLVESIETQKGKVKPLYFQQNRGKFRKYLGKIIHIAIQERHPEFSHWQRENYQRNAISRGLEQCKNEDIILITDLDEIPRSALLSQIINQLHSQHYRGLLNAVGLQQSSYFFQLNRQTPTKETWGGGKWVGTVVTTYKELKKADPQYFRDRRKLFPTISNAGWHFSWMGGKEAVRKKMASVVEGSDDPSAQSDEAIEKMLQKHPVVPIDQSYPKYILDHLDHFKEIGYIAS